MVLLLFILGLSALSVAFAWLLRAAGLKRTSILGGILAGAVLGPTVLGRLEPGWFEREIVGGEAQREKLDNARRGDAADELVLDRIGASRDDVKQAQAEARQQIARLERELQMARAQHQSGTRTIIFSVAALMTVLSGARSTRDPKSAQRLDWYSPASIGLWSACLPAGLMFLIFQWHGIAWPETVVAGAAVGVGPLSHALGDRVVSDEAEPGGAHLMRAASAVSSLVAAAMLFIAAWLASAGEDVRLINSLVWATPCALACAAIAAFRLPAPALGRLANVWLVPAVTACVVVRIELFVHFEVWLIVGALIVSGDGRWFGAYLGAMLCGARKSLRTMRLVLAAMGAAHGQLGVVAMSLAAGLMNEPAALSLLLGSLLMDTTLTTRKRVAEQIRSAEDEALS